ncbi:uncharacterized protein LOC118430133 [Branchiostoma floridae]|uniref:Uncharacterized protein LOC118430133 n=1 Tax=Branchiostoma floridae TaxID=7739 RepID=A0A9J7NBQ5_BRAFL|nr:uncharacterized protein LOC118430133 [Branchiostoma floridae]
MADGQTTTETAEEFALRMSTTVSSGYVTLAMSIGVRTGLFIHLSGLDGPRTAVQIAEATNLKERYVREWLAIMVTARIVDYDKEEKTCFLPPHRHNVLLPDAGRGSLGNMSEFMRQLAMVTGDVAECFKADGPKGVPYSAYPDFQGWLGRMRQYEHETDLVGKFLPTIPGLLEDLAEKRLGIRVHEAACGRGIMTLILAQHFPNSTFIGTDICEESIQWAEEESKKRDLANVTFQVQDLAKMPVEWSDSFDYVIVWDVIHDLEFPDLALREARRMVKPGGRFSMVDVKGHAELADNMDNPAGPALYGFSLLYCMTVSLCLGGKGLGAMWGQESAVQMLQEVGFDPQVLEVPDSEAEVHFLCVKN